MRSAAGFPCPKCKRDFKAEVRNLSVRILELRCHNTALHEDNKVVDWAVEMGHGTGWMDPKGEIRG